MNDLAGEFLRSGRRIFAMSLVFVALFSVSASSFAAGGGLGGDEFRKTAVEYDEKAEYYDRKGKLEISSIYKRMAHIKRDAAKMADKDLWDEIDWSEYEALDEKLIRLKKHK